MLNGNFLRAAPIEFYYLAWHGMSSPLLTIKPERTSSAAKLSARAEEGFDSIVEGGARGPGGRADRRIRQLGLTVCFGRTSRRPLARFRVAPPSRESISSSSSSSLRKSRFVKVVRAARDVRLMYWEVNHEITNSCGSVS